MENEVPTAEQLLNELILPALGASSSRQVTADGRLHGPGAVIDSIDLLNFLVLLESRIQEREGRFVPLLEEKTLKRILDEAGSPRELASLLVGLIQKNRTV
jgi:hypothetical protein